MIEEIKIMFNKSEVIKDLANIKIQDFYLKYLLRSDNWYFEKILGIEEKILFIQ